MKRLRRILFIAAVLSVTFLGISTDGYAQLGHQAASNLGLGGGGTAYVDSYHANFINPANLMLNEGTKPRFSIGLVGGISTNFGGPLVNISVYNEYFTNGRLISGSLANEALTDWFGSNPGNMRSAGLELDVIPLGTAYRADKWAASFALRSRVLFDMSISRGTAELLIHGFDGEVFSESRPVDFNIESLAFYEASFGYSRKLLTIPNLFGFAENVKVYAGIAPKLIMGANATSLRFNSTMQMQGTGGNEIDLIRHDFDYAIQTTGSLAGQLTDFYNDRQIMSKTPDINDYIEPDGADFTGLNATGWGFDLGGTVEMDLDMPFLGKFFEGKEKLRVGLAITDIGKVTFKDDVGRFVADDVLEWRGFTLNRQVIDNEFNGDRNAYLESVLVDSIATELYGSFGPEEGSKTISRPLSSRISLGGQLVMRRLSLALDFVKGFVEQGTSSERVSMSTGIEYRLFGFVPFRVGMRTGGLSSTSYSAGFGLEFRNFEFSLAASLVGNSLNHGTNVGAAWSGLVFRF